MLALAATLQTATRKLPDLPGNSPSDLHDGCTRGVEGDSIQTVPIAQTAVPAPRPPASIASTHDVPALVRNAAFRDRLVGRLDLAGVPATARTVYVAGLVGRAPQTVSRWLDPARPGLPDMESCARLCQGLLCSADWLLGLPGHSAERPSARSLGPVGGSDRRGLSALDLLDEMILGFWGCEPLRMVGDEMAPRIRDGDLLFVDASVNSLAGNGIHVLELDGKVLIRDVEHRIGAGLVFRCDNPAYKESVVRDAAAARGLGLSVIGRVMGTIAAIRFNGREAGSKLG